MIKSKLGRILVSLGVVLLTWGIAFSTLIAFNGTWQMQSLAVVLILIGEAALIILLETLFPERL